MKSYKTFGIVTFTVLLTLSIGLPLDSFANDDNVDSFAITGAYMDGNKKYVIVFNHSLESLPRNAVDDFEAKRNDKDVAISEVVVDDNALIITLVKSVGNTREGTLSYAGDSIKSEKDIVLESFLVVKLLESKQSEDKIYDVSVIDFELSEEVVIHTDSSPPPVVPSQDDNVIENTLPRTHDSSVFSSTQMEIVDAFMSGNKHWVFEFSEDIQTPLPSDIADAFTSTYEKRRSAPTDDNPIVNIEIFNSSVDKGLGDNFLRLQLTFSVAGERWSTIEYDPSSNAIQGKSSNTFAIGFKVEKQDNVDKNDEGVYPAILTKLLRITPTNLVATPDDGQVHLTWTAPDLNTLNPVTDYKIQYKETTSNTWLTYNDGVSTNVNVTVDGLTNDTQYDFKVIAIFNDSSEEESAVVTITVPIPLTLVDSIMDLSSIRWQMEFNKDVEASDPDEVADALIVKRSGDGIHFFNLTVTEVDITREFIEITVSNSIGNRAGSLIYDGNSQAIKSADGTFAPSFELAKELDVGANNGHYPDKIVSIGDAPTVDAGANKTIIEGLDRMFLNATGTGDIVSWKWEYLADISGQNHYDPTDVTPYEFNIDNATHQNTWFRDVFDDWPNFNYTYTNAPDIYSDDPNHTESYSFNVTATDAWNRNATDTVTYTVKTIGIEKALNDVVYTGRTVHDVTFDEELKLTCDVKLDSSLSDRYEIEWVSFHRSGTTVLTDLLNQETVFVTPERKGLTGYICEVYPNGQLSSFAIESIRVNAQ